MKGKDKTEKVKFKMLSVLEVFTILNVVCEGRHLASSVLRRVEHLAFLIVILLSVLTSFSLLPNAKAAVTITVTPPSGYVGDSVQVLGNITVTNGSYTILFDGNMMKAGVAIEGIVNDSFSIPFAAGGLHNVTVKDESGEASAGFTVLPRYFMFTDAPELPAQLRENGTLKLFLNMTGGAADATYAANVTLKTPEKTYWVKVPLSNTSDVGHYNATVTYPTTEWTPSGANTNYTGTYSYSWINGTNILGTGSFPVGVTNSTTYHRVDSIDIKAVDYPPSQSVNITISGIDNSFSANLTAAADIDGVVQANWPVPLNMSKGSYKLSITPVPSSKSQLNDTQIFTVPGFRTDVFARNLANETLPAVLVRAHDKALNVSIDSAGTEDNPPSFTLEKGQYDFEAFFKKVKVGETVNYTVSEEKPVNITCYLTNLNIIVVDAHDAKVGIPYVTIDIAYNYTTNLDVSENENETATDQTDITGVARFKSMLPNLMYRVNASRYAEIFNPDNDTISSLPAVDCLNVTILCPTETLQISVVDASNNSIAGVSVVAQEKLGGLYYDGTTDYQGVVVLDCVFGIYTVKVYSGLTLLNTTQVDLYQNQSKLIICQLYGLNISVRIVDYFGQSIPKARVTLHRNDFNQSLPTDSDGLASFIRVIGGDFHITIILPSQSEQSEPFLVTTAHLDNSTTIEIKVDRYVILGGMLVETSHFLLATITVVTVIVILSLEIIRRRRVKPQKSGSES